MTTHPKVEVLSTYLDEQLTGGKQRQVEAHLASCHRCRQRLRGLEKVVRDLEATSRAAPPPYLGVQVRRLVALETKRPSLVERLESSASRFTAQASIAPIFAVVVALIVIIYLLSWGLYRHESGRIPVHLEPPESAVEEPLPPTEPTIEGSAAGRRQKLDQIAPAGGRQAAGRTFDPSGNIWIERGLDPESPVERLEATDPAFQVWLERYPELEELARVGEVVRLRLEGVVVEILFPAP